MREDKQSDGHAGNRAVCGCDSDGIGDLPQAVLELICGLHTPSGLLPMQLPADMDTVEQQCEDVPFDMVCHTDEEGHVYDFGFGMDWNGVIDDERVKKYAHKK